MNGKIFGITWGLILTVVIVAFVARKWGGSIPLLNKVAVG